MYSDWCQLPLVTRIKIADAFGIKKTSATHVANNYVQSDGYAVKDIEKALNIPTLQAFLETEEKEPRVLWTMLVDKIEGKTIIQKFEESVVKDLNRPVVSEETPKEESKTLLPNLPKEKVEEIINNSELLNKKSNAKTKKSK